MNAEHLKQEAQRLLNDDVLKLAFDTARADALEALATADADDKTMILRLQQKIAAIDAIRSELHAMIIRGAETDNAASYA